jgi:hypothetical protein
LKADVDVALRRRAAMGRQEAFDFSDGRSQ